MVTCRGRKKLDNTVLVILGMGKTLLFLTLIITACYGLVFGMGLATFVYARGTSYLSDDPQACNNCHVMNSVFEGWMKGGHQHVATCNDCHVPHDFIGKWYTKADNGFHHSFAFTFFDIPLVIRAKEKSRQVVENNCVRCNGDMASHSASWPSRDGEILTCRSCHKDIGHGHGQ